MNTKKLITDLKQLNFTCWYITDSIYTVELGKSTYLKIDTSTDEFWFDCPYEKLLPKRLCRNVVYTKQRLKSRLFIWRTRSESAYKRYSILERNNAKIERDTLLYRLKKAKDLYENSETSMSKASKTFNVDYKTFKDFIIGNFGKL